MFRFSGTNVDYGYVRQVPGTVGAVVQSWVSERFVVEGMRPVIRRSDSSLARAALFFKTDAMPCLSGTVHNIGITFGNQFHK